MCFWLLDLKLSEIKIKTYYFVSLKCFFISVFKPESFPALSWPCSSSWLLSQFPTEFSRRKFRSDFGPELEAKRVVRSKVSDFAESSWSRTPCRPRHRQDLREVPAEVWSTRRSALSASSLFRCCRFRHLHFRHRCSFRRGCQAGFELPEGCEACWRRTRFEREEGEVDLPVLARKVS